MPDRIDPRDTLGKPAALAEDITLSEQERQALEAANKGYDAAAGALPERGKPPIPDPADPATRRAERKADKDAVTNAENEGMLPSETSALPVDGQR